MGGGCVTGEGDKARQMLWRIEDQWKMSAFEQGS